MYGYMLLNKKFYELGEIKLCGGENSGYEWTYGLPSYIDLSDHEAATLKYEKGLSGLN